MQDTMFTPVAGQGKTPEAVPGLAAPVSLSAPASPAAPVSVAAITSSSKLETGLGAWASAISADDNAQAAIALAEAINRARNSQANREHRASDARVIAVSRLETLRARLAPVYAAIPRDVELFDLGLVGHTPPRLFVDIIAFVELAEDGRTFRLQQESRSGRMLLGEAADEKQMTVLVTNYIAERLVERERALAAQGIHAKGPPLPKALAPAEVVKTAPGTLSASSPVLSEPEPVAIAAAEAPTNDVQRVEVQQAGVQQALELPRKIAEAATTAASNSVSGIGAAAAQAAQATTQQTSALASSAATAVIAATGAATAAAAMRQPAPASRGSGGWLWPLLALVIGVGLGALALYLYAANLARP